MLVYRCPQWSEDEALCTRSVTNEVHCFEAGTPGAALSNKLVVEGLASYSLSPSSPYKIAVYVPGSKGAPSFVRMYQYPRLEGAGSVIASRSFYRADDVKFSWNKKGSAVLVVTSTDVDKTGSSYYGEQGLLYLSARGDGNLVILDKKGPIYDVQWHPNSEEFCVLYGFMPSKATLFNNNSDPIHDFGTAHRNLAQFNPHGNILCLAGFGNLRGNMEFWDRKTLKLLSKPQASDSTHFQWCPDGVHVVTATTAPRLREGNGFKLWHFRGSLLFHEDTPPKQELLEVSWRPIPVSSFPVPDVTLPPPPSIQTASANPGQKAAYVPPALRGRPKPSGTPTGDETNLTKSAQKNRRKKQQQQPQQVVSGQSQEQRDAVSMATHLMGGAGSEGVSGGGGGDIAEKKIRNLKKKLRQIEQLKQQQADGGTLELNQLEKIKTEDSILAEIEKLELDSK
jgi:translation initiation factor 2A